MEKLQRFYDCLQNVVKGKNLKCFCRNRLIFLCRKVEECSVSAAHFPGFMCLCFAVAAFANLLRRVSDDLPRTHSLCKY